MPFKNPEAKREWRQKNRQRHAAQKKAWDAANPEKLSEYAKRSIERQKNANLVMKLFRENIDKTSVKIIEKESVFARHRRRLRERAIAYLGGKCEWCGLDEPYCLEIDHKKPIRRRTNGVKNHDSSRFCREIISGEEDNAQLLCSNCHTIKTRLESEYGNETAVEPFDPYAGLSV